ncbi:MAG: hypothetical protein RLZZ517_403 [Candidatus Parcubacteria bacterium]|jgi:Ca2+/Na+ antiporter
MLEDFRDFKINKQTLPRVFTIVLAIILLSLVRIIFDRSFIGGMLFLLFGGTYLLKRINRESKENNKWNLPKNFKEAPLTYKISIIVLTILMLLSIAMIPFYGSLFETFFLKF